jgi:hypothetical protein
MLQHVGCVANSRSIDIDAVLNQAPGNMTNRSRSITPGHGHARGAFHAIAEHAVPVHQNQTTCWSAPRSWQHQAPITRGHTIGAQKLCSKVKAWQPLHRLFHSCGLGRMSPTSAWCTCMRAVVSSCARDHDASTQPSDWRATERQVEKPGKVQSPDDRRGASMLWRKHTQWPTTVRASATFKYHAIARYSVEVLQLCG